MTGRLEAAAVLFVYLAVGVTVYAGILHSFFVADDFAYLHDIAASKSPSIIFSALAERYFRAMVVLAYQLALTIFMHRFDVLLGLPIVGLLAWGLTKPDFKSLAFIALCFGMHRILPVQKSPSGRGHCSHSARTSRPALTAV